ncbi:MAG: sugar kinase [Steroidobacteraceae bacterium]
MSGHDRKAVLITRKTRLEELIARFHTAAQAKFYVEHLGADFSDYELEHQTYQAAKRSVVEMLQRACLFQAVDRGFLSNFIFGPDDLVIALGQDGLVANTLKYLDGQPLVGINPDPGRYDGVLLPFEPGDLPAVLEEILHDRRPAKTVTMAKAMLSDGQVLHAVNDLFIGPKTHTSARYELSLGERHELQSSSGIIVSTGLGSTAWLKSVVTGSTLIAASFGADEQSVHYQPQSWDAPFLQFAVREPFPSVATQATLVCGRADQRRPLIVRSLMPEYGVIFSDGIESDYLEFNSGVTATISIAERAGTLIQ